MPNGEEGSSLFGRFSGWLDRTWVQGLAKAVVGEHSKVAPKIAEEIAKRLKSETLGVLDETWLNMLAYFVKEGLVPPAMVEPLQRMIKLPFPVDLLSVFTMMVAILPGGVKTLLQTTWRVTERAMASDFRHEIPHYSEILRATLLDPKSMPRVHQVLTEHGLTEEDIDLLLINLYQLIDPNTLRTLYHREAMSEDQVRGELNKAGFTDERVARMMKTWPVIPGVGDLITMVAHEAFEPAIIEQIGLGKEFPTEQLEWFKKQGVSEDWVKRYWYSHWVQPSIQMGFDMLHRGQIDKDILNTMFKLVEIPPFWRDKLTAIAYHPYTRVDVRRMHKVGTIDDAQLIRSYMDLGFDDEKALGMAEFTKTYNQGAEKSLSKSEVLRGYREKLIEDRDALNMLTELGYPEAEALYYLRFADYQEEKEAQASVVAAIQARYTGQLIDRKEAQRRLDELNLPAAQTKALLDKWQVGLVADTKLASKTDLEKFLRYKIISRDQYRVEMVKLGYPEQYINWYEALAAATAKPAESPPRVG